MLGSGQLGRMFAIAARRMGYRVHVFSPNRDSPAGQLADREVVGSYSDLAAVRAFAADVAAVTFEFENVPTATATACAELVPVRPGPHVLHVTQHRLREKEFLNTHGFATTPFRPVRLAADLNAAVAALGLPGVIKTATAGYDGKGQQTLNDPTDVPSAAEAVDGSNVEWIYEAFVDLTTEISVIVGRGVDGRTANWGAIENVHVNHILDVSFVPATLDGRLQEEAIGIAEAIVAALQVVGVLCVEFFVTRDGRLLVNELAPRPHNSGHLTIDACVTDQFEQQLRCVVDMPLGSTAYHAPAAAMGQLLGDLWTTGEPRWDRALADARMKLHLYGKDRPQRGRKMGHLTTTAKDAAAAHRLVDEARQRLV